MIELKNVVKRYPTVKHPDRFEQGHRRRTNAVEGISLNIERNGTTLIVGANGAGKTTLLSIIGGMTRPTSGRVIIAGRDISSLPEHFLSDIRKTHFGFVFQNNQLIHGISVIENIMVPAYTSGRKPAHLKQQAMAILEKFNIGFLANQKIENISGGEQQRVAIARALINDPEIIVADEPTAHLHPDLTAMFLKTVADLIREGKTVIISSHDAQLANSAIIERVIELAEGKVARDVQILPN